MHPPSHTSSLVCRSLVSPPPRSWWTEWGFVTTSRCCQLMQNLHLLTLVSFGSIGGGGWGLLCRMRTSSQWYEVIVKASVYVSFLVRWHCVRLTKVWKTFYINFVMQTMDRLKEMLDGINVTYDERTFETEGSIARLGALVNHFNDLSHFWH